MTSAKPVDYFNKSDTLSTPLLYIKYLHAVQTNKKLGPQILEVQLSRVVCISRVRPCI